CSCRSRPHGCPQGAGRLARAPAVDPAPALSPHAGERSLVPDEPDLVAVREHASNGARGAEVGNGTNGVALDHERRSVITDDVRDRSDAHRGAELVLDTALERMPVTVEPEDHSVIAGGDRFGGRRRGDGAKGHLRTGVVWFPADGPADFFESVRHPGCADDPRGAPREADHSIQVFVDPSGILVPPREGLSLHVALGADDERAVGTGVGVAGGGVGVPRVTTPKAAPAPTARTSMIAAAARAVLVRSVPGGISPSPRVSLCAPRSADGCRRGGQRTPERPLTGSRYRGTRSPCWPPRAAPCLLQSFAGPTRGPAGNG